MQAKKSLLFVVPMLLALAACQHTGDSTLPSSTSSSSPTSSSLPISSLPNSSSSQGSSSTAGGQGSAGIEKILSQLTAPEGFAFTGSYVLDGEGGNIAGFVSDNEFYSAEAGDEIHYYRGTGEYKDYTVGHFLSPHNMLMEVPYVDSYGSPILFDRYANPLGEISISDFVAHEGFYSVDIEDEVLQNRLGLAFTGYSSLAFDSLRIDYDFDGTVSALSFSSSDGFLFDATITTREEAGIPEELSPRPHEEGHDALGEAFAELAEGNYSFTMTEETSGGDILSFTSRFDDRAIVIETSTGKSGYLQVEDGVAPVDFLENGSAQATGETLSGYTLSDAKASFDVAPELFTILNESTYILTPNIGMDLYSYDFSVESSITDTYEYMNANTYSFKIDGDGTYTVSYTCDFFGISSIITIDIFDVGTTDTGYDAEDYLPPAPVVGWDDFGIGEYLDSYAGGSENLPFPDDIPGLSVEEGDIGVAFGMIFVSFDPSVYATVETAVQAYGEALEEKGWVYEGLNGFGEAAYTLKKGNARYYIGLSSSFSNQFVIYFYEPEVLSESPLGQFIDETFSESVNATLKTMVEYDLYSATENDVSSGTGTYGDFLGHYTNNTINYFTDEALYSTVDENGQKSESYAVETGEHSFDYYTKSGDQPWKKESYVDWDILDFFFTPRDLVGNVSEFLVEGENGNYTFSDDSALEYLTMCFFLYSIPANAISNYSITYDPVDQTLRVHIEAGGYFQSETGGYEYRDLTMDAALSDIGETLITAPDVE